MEQKQVAFTTLKEMKQQGVPITMVTAYDYPTARLVDESGIDTVLVGGSAGNVVLGYPDTIPVTVDELLHHTRAVRRGLRRALLIGDMPFMSYERLSTDDSAVYTTDTEFVVVGFDTEYWAFSAGVSLFFP